MLVTDIVRRSVTGNLRFDFIESTITASNGCKLSSQKGCAQSDPVDGCFIYHFQPRGAFRDDWICEGGYFDQSQQAIEGGGVYFSVSGVERSSAIWTARAVQLRLARSAEGSTVHGRVKEWTRADEHSVNSSFMRVIVPGEYLYPTTVRHAPGHNTRGAAVTIDGARIEFRDYGGYTEISAINTSELPEHFPEHVVAALARVLDRPLDWVCKEQHRNRRRIVTVQRPANIGSVPAPDTGDASTANYREFWQAYAEELATLL